MSALSPLSSTGVPELIPAIKTEPKEVGERLYLSEIIVERLKSEEEQKLYADHEIKEEIVIGPTEVQRPALTLHPDAAPKKTATPPPAPLPSSVPTPAAVDIDDIEAEDVYAFRDIDIHIPPVATIHKGRVRPADKPSVQKNDMEIADTIERHAENIAQASIHHDVMDEPIPLHTSTTLALSMELTHFDDITAALPAPVASNPAQEHVNDAADARIEPVTNINFDDGHIRRCRVRLTEARDELLCGLCGKWSISAPELQLHKRTHADEESHSTLIQFEERGPADNEKTATPPPAPLPSSVPTPAAVDIDDIEAEDVYAFRDIDIHIPPVATIHKGRVRPADKPSVQKNDMEIADTIERHAENIAQASIHHDVMDEPIPLHTSTTLALSMELTHFDDITAALPAPVASNPAQEHVNDAADARIEPVTNINFDDGHIRRCRVRLTEARDELLCGLCGKWSISAPELQLHKRTHADEESHSTLIQFEERGPADNEKTATPPPAPLPSSVPTPAAVDIDDIEAEDVYAFRDIDIHIPPVATIHKGSVRPADKPSVQKNDMEIADTIERHAENIAQASIHHDVMDEPIPLHTSTTLALSMELTHFDDITAALPAPVASNPAQEHVNDAADARTEPVTNINFDDGHIRRCRVRLTEARDELLCGLCGKWSISAPELQLHKRTHADEESHSTLIQFEERGPADNGDVPPCPALGAEYDVSRVLPCRVGVRDARDELLCSQCGEWSLTAARLQRHRQTHATRVQPTHGCHPTPTHTTFSQKGHLKTHKLVHSGDKPFSCEICSKSFSKSNDLKRHVLTHSKLKPFTCDICDKTFSLKGNLKKHILVHSGDKPFSCEICSKSFSESSDLKRHMLLTHSKLNPFSCDICDKTFSLKGNLNKHKLVHSGDKPFSCEICSKSFSTSNDLKRHMLTHSKLKPFTCDICDKTFSLKGNLKKHKLVHNGDKPFSCEICSKSFSQSYHLKIHLLTHSKLKQFSCDICDKTFSLKGNLKKHKLVHSGDKPFSCEICSKSFRLSNHLKIHLLTHSKIKPFACDICDKTFSLKDQLKIHIMRLHSGDKPFPFK